MSGQPAAGLTDGEHIALPLVGSRSYVRALDVVALCESRSTDFTELRLHFRRPLTPLVRVGRSRTPETSAQLTVTRPGQAPETFFLDGLVPTDVRRVAEAELCPHWALKRRGSRQLHLIDGRIAEYRKLEVIFADFQDASGERFVVRNLVLRSAVSYALDLIVVTHAEPGAGQPTTFRMTKNARPWCELAVIPARGAVFARGAQRALPAATTSPDRSDSGEVAEDQQRL